MDCIKRRGHKPSVHHQRGAHCHLVQASLCCMTVTIYVRPLPAVHSMKILYLSVSLFMCSRYYFLEESSMSMSFMAFEVFSKIECIFMSPIVCRRLSSLLGWLESFTSAPWLSVLPFSRRTQERMVKDVKQSTVFAF